ncbi:MAG: NYN domain-containing protein [Acidobacteria bacterium]|nr:NYN domain-containing protein [Acidobacteriota bacterium]
MTTNVYIDGFNLYYGAVKNTPYKWLNLAELFRFLLPKHSIQRIKYFTALVRSYPHDPDAPTRQRTYLRALATIPNLSIHYGHFLANPVSMPAFPLTNPPQKVRVLKVEEKGSDVNLAAHMLWDGFRRDYECAVVVSNDSDLLEPIRIVRRELGIPVGVINPRPEIPSAVLLQHASFFKKLRRGLLAKCQFSNPMVDHKGEFHKPSSW